MRKTIALGLLLATASALGTARAQSAGDFAKLNVADISAPDLPALVLLGVSPSAVQRPQTPRALTASLLSIAKGSGGVEVAPFWLVSQPDFTFEDQYARGPFASVIQKAILSTSAFSLASSSKVKGKDTVGTSLGFGYSVSLWPGQAEPRLIVLKDSLVKELGRCAAVIDHDALVACYKKLHPVMDSLKKHSDPVGFKLQVAAGGVAQIPFDSLSKKSYKSTGMWVTPSYSIISQLEFIAVARWLNVRSDTAGTAATTNFDFGARLLLRPIERLGVSFEALQRNASGGAATSSSTQRYGGVVEFLTANDVYVQYAIGQDFAARNVKSNPFFASLGIHLGFGSKPSVDVK